MPAQTTAVIPAQTTAVKVGPEKCVCATGGGCKGSRRPDEQRAH